MNLNFKKSYQSMKWKQLLFQPSLLSKKIPSNAIQYLLSDLTVFSTSDLIDIDYSLGRYCQEIRQQINQYINQQDKNNLINETKLIKSLQDLLKVIKKIEFYRLQVSLSHLFQGIDGLHSIYKFGKSIKILSLVVNLEKFLYQPQKIDKRQSICQYMLYREIFHQMLNKNVFLFLKQIEEQGYQECLNWPAHILQNGQPWRINYDLTVAQNLKIFQELNQNSHEQKKIKLHFQILIQYQLKELENVCAFLTLVKNHLLDKKTGVMYGQEFVWTKTYSICLKIYQRNREVRDKQYLQIDQIMSSTFLETEFMEFILRNQNKNVSLSSMNFFMKNTPQSSKSVLIESLTKKTYELIQTKGWKYIQDIIQYLDNECPKNDYQIIMGRITDNMGDLVEQIPFDCSLFDIEYSLHFLLYHLSKHPNKYKVILNNVFLNRVLKKLKNQNIKLLQVKIIHQIIVTFLEMTFEETAQIQIYLKDNINICEPLFEIFQLLLSFNCYLSQAIFKLFEVNVTNQHIFSNIENIFWKIFATTLITPPEMYEISGTFGLTNTHKKQKLQQNLTKLLDKLSKTQFIERQELQKYFENKNNYSKEYIQSYLMGKSFKQQYSYQSLMFVSSQFSCIIPFQLIFSLISQSLSPLVNCKAWNQTNSNGETQDIMDVITNQIPIEILRVIFHRLKNKVNLNFSWAKSLGPSFWNGYWSTQRSSFIKSLVSEFSLDINAYDMLHQMRKTQFVFNLFNSVFDKLNDEARKGLKQIQQLYTIASEYSFCIWNQIFPLLFEDTIDYFERQSDEFYRRSKIEAYKGLDQRGYIANEFELCNEDLVIDYNIIKKYQILQNIRGLNLIGKVLNDHYYEVMLIKMSSFTRQNQNEEQYSRTKRYLFGKYIQCFILVQKRWQNYLQVDQDYKFEQIPREYQDLLRKTKQLFKELQKNIKEQKQSTDPYIQKLRVNLHQNLCVNLLPAMIKYSFRNTKCKQIICLEFDTYEQIIRLIEALVPDQQQHFIILMEVVEEELIDKDEINQQLTEIYLLSFFQLFIKCIFNSIRIRSYHLFKLIKKYTQINPTATLVFNSIVLHYIRYLFRVYVPDYQNPNNVLSLSIGNHNHDTQSMIQNKKQQLISYEPKFKPSESCCIMSMFINLFSRINFSELGRGVETIFHQENAKLHFLQYLIGLSENLSKVDVGQITKREKEIICVDIFGNLNILFKNSTKSIFVKPLVRLTKVMFNLSVDFNGANSLPLKVLTKFAHKNQIPLQQFQQHQKALSLAVLSYHKKISPNIAGNLHFCNLSYVLGNHFTQCAKQLEVNSHPILARMAKKEFFNLLRNSEKVNILPTPEQLQVSIGSKSIEYFKSLINKFIQKYYIVGKQQINGLKLYNTFKIIVTIALNNPQLIPILSQFQIVNLNNQKVSMESIIIDSLKYGFCMFLEYYCLIAKTNSNFYLIDGSLIPDNLAIEIRLKKHLISFIKQETIPLTYVIQVIIFITQHSAEYRFRAYRFIKCNNPLYEKIVEQLDKQWQSQVYEIVSRKMTNKSTQHKDYLWLKLSKVMLNKLINNKIYEFYKSELNQEIKIRCHEKLDSNKQKKSLNVNKENKGQNLEKNKSELDKKNEIKVFSQILNFVNNQPICSYKNSLNNKSFQGNPKIQYQLINFSHSQQLPIPSQKNLHSTIFTALITQSRQINDKFLHCDLLNIEEQLTFQQNKQQDFRIIQGNSDDGIREDDGDQIREDDDQIREKDQIRQDDGDEIRQDDDEIRQFNSKQMQQGSIKLFNEQQQDLVANNQENEIVSKDQFLNLIEQYCLNPEVIKLIIKKIPKVKTQVLQKISNTVDGELKFRIQQQLRIRGINKYQQNHHYLCSEKIRSIGYKLGSLKEVMIKIPILTQQHILEMVVDLCQSCIHNRKQEKQVYWNVINKLILNIDNFGIFLNVCIGLLVSNNQQFCLYGFSKDTHLTKVKNVIVNEIIQSMISLNIGLDIIILQKWNYEKSRINNFEHFNKTSVKNIGHSRIGSEPIISIIIRVLLEDKTNNNKFLNSMEKIMQKSKGSLICFNQFQQTQQLDKSIIKGISERLRKNFITFSQHQYINKLFKFILFIDSRALQVFFQIELPYITQFVHNLLHREQLVLQLFKSSYKTETQSWKLCESYWNLRKHKKTSIHQIQLQFISQLLIDIATDIVPFFKQSRLRFHHQNNIQQWESKLYEAKEQLTYKMGDDFICAQAKVRQLSVEFDCWKNRQLSEITLGEITPFVQENGSELIKILGKCSQFLDELISLFGIQEDILMSIYGVMGQMYKIMLSLQVMSKEEQLTYHSMSVLKTKPQLESFQNLPMARRNSNSRKSIKLSLIPSLSLGIQYNLKMIANKCQLFRNILIQYPQLLLLHAAYGGADSRIKLIQLKQDYLTQKVIQCDRQSIWSDSLRQIDEKFPKTNLKIKFKGQLGLDYGGVSRQWVTLVVKQLLNPNLGLFQLSVNKLSFQPSRRSWLVPNHLVHFQKFGMFVGKAMKQNWLLEINFTKSFLKHLLGRTLYVEDLEDVDPDTSKGLLYILSNEIGEDLGLTFSYDYYCLDKRQVVQLVPGGENILVNEENKKDYVKKMAVSKMTQQIRNQSKAFMIGLERLIPYEALRLFTHQQIGVYLAGMPQIDVKEMKKWARYEKYDVKDQNIQWFWATLESWDERLKANFLFYLTGSYKVPYGGFKDYPITINRMTNSTNFLPVAHTCFSVIDLPDYTSQQKLAQQFKKAVEEGRGFSVS